MRIAQCSDAHLGYQRFGGARSSTRKADFIRCWRAAINKTLEWDPDVIVFPGDFFDSPDPDNESLYEAIYGLLRISEAGIVPLAISGNHDTPKSIRGHVGSIINEVLESSGGGGRFVYEDTEVVDVDDVRFVCVPWKNEKLEWEFLPDGDVLVIHVAFAPAIFGQDRLRVLKEDTPLPYKFSALGDWHERVEVQRDAWYSGGIERLSFGEERSECGMLLVDLNSKEVTPWDSPARHMVTLEFDLNDMTSPDIELTEKLTPFADSCVRLRLKGDPSRLDPKSLEWHPLCQKEFMGSAFLESDGRAPRESPITWEEFCYDNEIDYHIYRYGKHFLRKHGIL